MEQPSLRGASARPQVVGQGHRLSVDPGSRRPRPDSGCCCFPFPSDHPLILEAVPGQCNRVSGWFAPAARFERTVGRAPLPAEPASAVPVHTIACVSQQSFGGNPPSPEDPNLSVAGARQRKGPFWMEEPRWFWLLACITFLLGLVLFLVAVGFDRP